VPRSVPVSQFGMLLSVALAALLAACGGGSDGTPPAATPSPAVAETRSPTAAADSMPGDEDTLYAPDVVKKLRPSVVHVLSEAATLDVFGQVTPTQGVGTGFIIDEEGHIVTNNHVITVDSDQPAHRITITLDDGQQFQASIVGRDAPTDLAVLKIDAGGLTPADLGSSEALEVGDDVLAIGNALDLAGGPTVTRGVVSAKGRLIQEGDTTIPDAIQTDASINPGNSGGPLVNKDGEVVGITTAVIRGQAEGIGLAISIDSVRPIVEELIDTGHVDRGFLGVSIVEITPALADSFGLAVDRGIGLRDVQPGRRRGPAGWRRNREAGRPGGQQLGGSVPGLDRPPGGGDGHRGVLSRRHTDER
jgi:serine protease Do